MLTSLAGRERLSNDDLEALFERVDAKLATIPKESWAFDALERVVGKNAQRKRDALFVLVALAGAPGAEASILRFSGGPERARARRASVRATVAS